MATTKQLSDFLVSIERRAYKQALFASRDEEAALDIVQDSMMKLVARYGDRPEEELPLLFQRILQNCIRDHFRRSKIRNLWSTLLSAFGPREDDDHDPLENVGDDRPGYWAKTPEDQLDQHQTLKIIEAEISKLPPRQREAFLMRYWEDMNVAETAAAMGCSEGSVKTHCSRATHTLAAALEKKGIKP
ncbi:RNA polymerase sigma factor [Azovibrio restrictus]|uniref:RNA polymerase sigma factor n=1 Tax=Azovibrio restrictus TaxID=146938 RepID=UPI0026F23900|nr:RNA polymerase sigma factor [Azovibrio restrictus]